MVAKDANKNRCSIPNSPSCPTARVGANGCAGSKLQSSPRPRQSRYAGAIRALDNGAGDGGPPELTPTELLTVTTIAYLQPATRGELSRLVGKEVSRDIIGRLKSLGLIAAGPRAPEPGAPYAYVTTRKFLEVFGLASLRTCPTSKSSKTPDCCNGPLT